MSQDPRAQAMFDKLGQQAMETLSSEQGAEMIANDAKTSGPAQAIAKAVQSVVEGIGKAAAQAGVDLPPDVMGQATQTLAKVLAALMVESGIAKDPKALMAELDQLLGGESDEEPGEAAEGETPAYEAQEEADPSLEAGEPGEEVEPPDERKGALMRGGA